MREPVFGWLVDQSSTQRCIDLPHGNVSAFDVPRTSASANKGQLYVKLNKVTKLNNKYTFGKSNLFIEMWLESHYKQRSKDAKGLYPIFNETFCFYVHPGQDTLHIGVADSDAFSNDEIGQAKIPLANIFKTGREGPRDYGMINMQMQYIADRTP
ncbi:hypothetical protein BG006_000132 [Podila minutissima]|uniref:C2 domain-containing protein n=1 Tax=Podila minutissima TaxID=64525 RepID=A0A9P5SU82_9FUNG|nr:hypothetical protein BG006_000132 [Podila minutissima]